MYTKEKYEMPEGFVDLSEEVKPISIEMPEIEEEEEKEYHYPTLYFSNADGLKNLPKEGTATIVFKKTMERSETITRNGKTEKKHCVELCICGIKPESSDKMEMTMEDDENEIENGLKEAEEE